MEQKRIQKAENLDGVRNAFAPEPLDGINLDEENGLYCNCTMENRVDDIHDSPLDNLFEACTNPTAQNAHLLLGHRGCGKSTELNQLKRRFKDENYPVVIIDCQYEMDIFNATHWDLMLLITDGLCRIAIEQKIDLPPNTVDAVYDFLLQDIVYETEVDKNTSLGAELGIGTETPPFLGRLFNAFARVKGDMKYSERTREKISEKMKKRVSEWEAYTRLIADYIKNHNDGREPVLIFESLDKFGFANTPEQIFEVFRYNALASMPFPIIYTFPISQFYSPQFADLDGLYSTHTLPMIKVINKNGTRNSSGIESIRRIVNLRIAEGFELFSNKSDENGDDVLTVLIVKTGGLLRHLFECILSAATRAKRAGKTQIELEDANRALQKIRTDLTKRLEGADYGNLAAVYNNIKLREEIKDRKFLLSMLQALTLVEYNGERWHDVHPLVADFLANLGMVTLRGQK